MNIYLGTDHAGFKLKESVKAYLKGMGYNVQDQGAFEYDEKDDYPDFVKLVALQVAGDSGSMGIIFGMSGQGEAITANRYKGVRAAEYYGGQEEIVLLSRAHNDANVLSLGAKFVSEEEAQKVVHIWISTPFSGEERHKRRIEKIDSNVRQISEF